MEWNQKKVLVVGCGKSGIAAMKLLASSGADAILYDGNETLSEEKVRETLKNAGMQETEQVKIVLGELPAFVEESLDAMVLSPGVPTDLPWIERIRQKGVLILGEIELAYLFEKGNSFKD